MTFCIRSQFTTPVAGDKSRMDKVLKLHFFFLLCLIGILSDKDSLSGSKNYLYIICIVFSEYKSNTYKSSLNFSGLSKMQLTIYLKEQMEEGCHESGGLILSRVLTEVTRYELFFFFFIFEL